MFLSVRVLFLSLKPINGSLFKFKYTNKTREYIWSSSFPLQYPITAYLLEAFAAVGDGHSVAGVRVVYHDDLLGDLEIFLRDQLHHVPGVIREDSH